MKTVYLSGYGEQNWLNYFWGSVSDDSVDRLEMLGKLSSVAVARSPIKGVRQWSEEERTRFRASARGCFCCRTQGRELIWHHIIQVQHGGSGGLINQVPLCKRCHAGVHPWLLPDVTLRTPWTSVPQLLRDHGIPYLERILNQAERAS